MFEKIKDLDDLRFKRLTGITRKVFNFMVQILSEENKKLKAKGGRKNQRFERILLFITSQLLVLW